MGCRTRSEPKSPSRWTRGKNTTTDYIWVRLCISGGSIGAWHRAKSQNQLCSCNANELMASRVNKQIVCYLATIRNGMERDHRKQERFWQKATQALHALHLEETKQRRVEKLLMRVVPKPEPIPKDTSESNPLKTPRFRSAVDSLEKLRVDYLSANQSFWDGLEQALRHNGVITIIQTIRREEEDQARERTSGRTISDLLTNSLRDRDDFWDSRAFLDRLTRYLNAASTESRDKVRVAFLSRMSELDRIYKLRDDLVKQAQTIHALTGSSSIEDLVAEMPDLGRMLLNALST